MEAYAPWTTLALLLFMIVALRMIERRLTSLEEGQLQLMRHLGLLDAAGTEPSDKVKALALDPKQQIEAIKAYRQQTGAGLKEARAVVQGLRGQA